MALAADPAASSFDMGHLALAFAAGSAVTLGIQSLRTRFAANFETEKQAALSRVLPSLDGVEIPAEAKLVVLPAGEFTMRDNYGDLSREKPEHRVVLSVFYMMECDVSNGFFRNFRLSHHSSDGFDGDNQNVVNVDHNDALGFANWMNENHGVAGMEWRLPTEAELEYAMRGKDQRTTDAVDLDRVNVHASDHGKTLDVDSEAHKNNYELFHIRGNVWKWCLDRFGNYLAEPVINPHGTTEGDMFVLRGGGYGSYGHFLSLAHREFFNRDLRDNDSEPSRI